MLGIREPEIYGTRTYDDLVSFIREERGSRHEISFMQSNHEGEIIDAIHQAYFDGMDGIIINPAAYTHTSIAIMDALKSVPVKAVEVHISNPDDREEYRKISYAGQACVKSIKGHGFAGYIEAIDYIEGDGPGGYFFTKRGQSFAMIK